MSRSSSSFTSSSYVSFSSNSSTNVNGQQTGHSYSQQSSTTPAGTTTRTTTQQLGQPSVEEVRHYDNRGQELLNAPTGSNTNQRRIQGDFEVEDVTDEVDAADKKYREAIEDEYAKREGGA